MGTLDQSLSKILEKSRHAAKLWAQTPLSERNKWLKNFQKLLVKKSEAVVEAIQSDTGKPATEGLGIELATVLMTADYYRKRSKKFLKSRRAATHWMFKNKRVTVAQISYGVVGILGPFNLPFSLTIGDAIPALVAGNSVIIKPSEWTPKSAQAGMELALESGLPEDVLQVVLGGGEVGSRLIQEVDCIFFTGSTAVGKKVAAKAGELLKPCILELGGKAPMIVLEDADIERAARACVWGRFAHSGQHCIAVERVYVDQKVAAPFCNEVVRITQKICKDELSPNRLPKTTTHLQELLQDALAKGAHVVYPLQNGAAPFWEPIILTNANHTMRVMKEEAFGPLLPIMTVASPEEAIRLANESESGLSAYIFGEDKEKLGTYAKQIEAGSVAINDVMDQFMIMDAPFGGWKQSGLGTRHSQEGLLQFTKPQTIFVHRFPLPFCRKREFWWFPYTKGVKKLLKVLLKLFFG